MANLCFSKSEITQKMIKLNILNFFLSKMHSQNTEIKYNAFWGIGNLVGGSRRIRDELLAKNIHEVFL